MMNTLKAKASQYTTETLIDAIRKIGGATPEHKLSRAAMLTVIQERLGDDACDALIDELGL